MLSIIFQVNGRVCSTKPYLLRPDFKCIHWYLKTVENQNKNLQISLVLGVSLSGYGCAFQRTNLHFSLTLNLCKLSEYFIVGGEL